MIQEPATGDDKKCVEERTVTDARRTAGGILMAAATGDVRRLRQELARADRPSAAGAGGDTGEQERLELLAAVSQGLLTTLERSRRHPDAPPEHRGLYLRLLRHLAGPSAAPVTYRVRKATASISTCTSRGSRAASTVARAGALSLK